MLIPCRCYRVDRWSNTWKEVTFIITIVYSLMDIFQQHCHHQLSLPELLFEGLSIASSAGLLKSLSVPIPKSPRWKKNWSNIDAVFLNEGGMHSGLNPMKHVFSVFFTLIIVPNYDLVGIVSNCVNALIFSGFFNCNPLNTCSSTARIVSSFIFKNRFWYVFIKEKVTYPHQIIQSWPLLACLKLG